MFINLDKIAQMKKRKSELAWLAACLAEFGVKPERLIDFGCAQGVGTIALAWAIGAKTTIGLDKDQQALNIARTLVSEVKYQIPILRNIDFQFESADISAPITSIETASADLVHCERVLDKLWCSHSGNARIDTLQAIHEMARIVKPGGVIVSIEGEWCDPDYPGTRIELEPLFEQVEEIEKVWVKSLASLRHEREWHHEKGHILHTWVYIFRRR